MVGLRGGFALQLDSPAEPHSTRGLYLARRMHAYPRIAIAVYLLVFLGLVLASDNLVDRQGRPLGYDFSAFWGASYLTLDGRPQDAFDKDQILAAERVAVPQTQKYYRWWYPPPYQLLIAPLALLPYAAAYCAFVGLTLVAYLFALRRLLHQPEALPLLLAFPGTFICLLQGQNSFLTAALFAGGILCLRSRPILAGVLFGLLIYKPQFGLLIPIALMASGRHRTFVAAAATCLAFSAVATIFFGFGLWLTFFDHLGVALTLIGDGRKPWEKLPTAFVFLRMLGVPAVMAFVAQAATALAAAAVVAHVWRRCGPSLLAGAVLVAGTLVALPYVFDHEMAVLAAPLAILASDMAERGSLPWERAALATIYVTPFGMVAIAQATNLQIGFPALAATLFLAARRALASNLLRSPVRGAMVGAVAE